MQTLHARDLFLGTNAERISLTPDHNGTRFFTTDTSDFYVYYGAWILIGGGGGGVPYLRLDMTNDASISGHMGIPAGYSLKIGEDNTARAQKLTIVEPSGTDAATHYVSGSTTGGNVTATITGENSGIPVWTPLALINVCGDAGGPGCGPIAPSGGLSGTLTARINNPSIPAGSTIVGIKVEVTRTSNFDPVHDATAYLVDGATIISPNVANATEWAQTPAWDTVTYGSATDPIGTVTAAQLNAGTIGFQLVCYASGGAMLGATAQVDCIVITIYYGGIGWATGADASSTTFRISPGSTLDDTGYVQIRPDVGNSRTFLEVESGHTLAVSQQFISTLATGTSPFSITSTTLNTNLNSDLWEGLHMPVLDSGKYLTNNGATLSWGTISSGISGTEWYIPKFLGGGVTIGNSALRQDSLANPSIYLDGTDTQYKGLEWKDTSSNEEWGISHRTHADGNRFETYYYSGATWYRYWYWDTSGNALSTVTVGAKPDTTAGVRLDPNAATGNFTGSLSPANLSANRRWTFPDADLTLSAAAGGTGTSGRVAQWGATNSLTTANLIGPAANVLTLTATAASTLAAAITAGKTLTLTATNDFNLTIPATGTAALLATANVFTTGQKINANSATALFVEQDGVKDNVFIVNTATAQIGINKAPSITLDIFSGTPNTLTCTGAYNATTGVTLQFRRARGTQTVPLPLLSGDRIGQFSFMADDGGGGGGFVIVSEFGFKTNTVVGDGFFYLSPSNGSPITSVYSAVSSAGINTLERFDFYGTSANNDGGRLILAGQDTSGLSVDMSYIDWIMTNATHATLTADLVLSTTYNNAVAERLRIGSNGVSVTGIRDVQQFLVNGFTTQAVATAVAQVTRADAAAGVSAMLGLTALGSGANGDGGSILLNGKTNTTAAQSMSRIRWLWVDATHASRKASIVLSAYDTAERDGMTIAASGTAAMIGFLGAAAVAQQANTVGLETVLSNFGLRASGAATLTDDFTFVGAGTGLPYGGMYGENIAYDLVMAAQDTDYQITGFATAADSNLVTVSVANDDLTITKTGVYLVGWNAACHSHASNDFVIFVSVNNGTTVKVNTKAHFDSTVGDRTFHVGCSDICSFAANDTVELWAHRNDGGAVSKTLTFDHVNLHVTQIGG